MKNSKGMIGYGLAKSLIFRLAELMNEEAKGKNIVTSVVVPSTIDTPQNRASMPDADFTKWVTPQAIAEVIYFYCSDEGMAGVKKMIVSLWQVPDKETAELMTAFYTYWMKGKTIEESFSQAQADMRKKYSPFYWAAFVLVE